MRQAFEGKVLRFWESRVGKLGKEGGDTLAVRSDNRTGGDIGDDDISGWNGENKAGIVCPARSEASTC
ncbi:hypothetical protein H9L39_07690 [Fusarium oxysporum f. sp. albedinis]|nr:hypothetical protein H9L39_07690 [Fusarium oxysporum f. sp. albedinis]